MRFKPPEAGSIGIITNYRCTGNCPHCLYYSSPDVNEHPEFGIINRIITQASELLPGIPVHIGGGEPFLYPEFLERTVKSVSESALELEYVETNGKLLSGENATETLLRLRNLGLERILLSVSPFHHSSVTLGENLSARENIISVFGSAGIFPWHDLYYRYMENFDESEKIPFTRYIKELHEGSLREILTEIIYIHPGGRAAGLFASCLGTYPAERFFDKNCRAEASSPVHVHLDYTGSYCAGFCAGITLGKGSALNLDSLYGKGIELKEYPLLDILINRSLGDLFRYASDRGFWGRSGYSSPCHLCLALRVFLYKKFPGLYSELAPDIFYIQAERELKNSG